MDKKIYIKDVLRECDGKLIKGDENTELVSFSKDTRTLQKGDTYIGIKGESFDGGTFYKDAFSNGASSCILNSNIEVDLSLIPDGGSVIVVDDTLDALEKLASYKRSLYDIPVIAVTGSVGKTSTRDLIGCVLKTKYKVLQTEKNFNNNIGMPLTILSLKDEDILLLEMGMNHFGELHKLSSIAKPTLAVITNIGTAHIGNLGSRENILKAKLEILDGMDEKVLVTNIDNDIISSHIDEIKQKSTVTTVGIDANADYNATDINRDVFSSSFKINGIDFTVNAGGKAYIYNSLVAYAVGKKFDISDQDIKEGIDKFRLGENRLEKIEIKNGVTLINDTYNASLDSIKNSMELLHNSKFSRKILVLGDVLELGEYSNSIHEEIFKEILKYKFDYLIMVGPELKKASKVLEDANYDMNTVYFFNNEKESYDTIDKLLSPGDVMLLKGSHSMDLINIVNRLRGQ